MAERFRFCETNLDWLRHLMLREPRGYPAMCCSIAMPPATPGADVGLIVLEQDGFTPMSGSNTMCAVTALLETGALPMEEPVTRVVLDTAVGLVHVEAQVSGGKVERVLIHNVPAFVVWRDEPLDVPGVGRVKVDIAFGGQFFVLAAAADVGVRLVPSEAARVAKVGELVKIAAQQKFPVHHPLNPDINRITLAMLYGPSDTPGVSGRNGVVCTSGPLDLKADAGCSGVLDRSPCGTGTCARMAMLFARGELGLHQPFVHESVLGTTFRGELVSETEIGDYSAVVPTISGRAWVTGLSNYVLDDSDPFPEGFVIGDIWPGGPE